MAQNEGLPSIDEIAFDVGTQLPYIKPFSLKNLGTLLQMRMDREEKEQTRSEEDSLYLELIKKQLDDFLIRLRACKYPGSGDPRSAEAAAKVQQLSDIARERTLFQVIPLYELKNVVSRTILYQRDSIRELLRECNALALLYEEKEDLHGQIRTLETLCRIVNGALVTYAEEARPEAIHKHMKSKPPLQTALRGIATVDSKILEWLNSGLNKDHGAVRALVVHGLIEYRPQLRQKGNGMKNYCLTKNGKEVMEWMESTEGRKFLQEKRDTIE